jgi:hypothetical protein
MAPASSGPPPQSSAVWDTCLASAELLCSRLLGLDLSAMGRGLGKTGYAAAQVWFHAEFERTSPGLLADLERMLQRTVDGQPPRLDGAATGWLQGVTYRLMAGRPDEGGFGLLAPWEHLVARGAKWATELVEGLCPPVLHGPCHPPPRPSPICCRRPPICCHRRNQRSCLRTYGPWPISQCAGQHKPLQQQQALYPQSQAGLGWHGVWFFVFALPSIHSVTATLLCEAFCGPEAVVSGSSPLPVLNVCSSQFGLY